MGCRFLIFISLLVASLVQVPAHARRDCLALKQEREFSSTVLSLGKKIWLQDLKAAGLIERTDTYEGRYLWKLKGQVTPPSPEESAAATKLSLALGQPILLAPHLPGVGSLPVVDAILFATDGRPLANLSIKSPEVRDDFETARFYVRRITGRVQFRYSFSYLASLWGFVVNEENRLFVPYDRRTICEADTLMATMKLLGISMDGGPNRPLMGVIDFLRMPDVQANVERRRTERGFEDLLQMTNGNGVANSNPVNLTNAQAHLARKQVFKTIYFLFRDSLVKLEKDRLSQRTLATLNPCQDQLSPVSEEQL